MWNPTLIIFGFRKIPHLRLGHGVGGFNQIRKHKWYRDFKWEGKKSYGYTDLKNRFYRTPISNYSTAYYPNNLKPSGHFLFWQLLKQHLVWLQQWCWGENYVEWRKINTQQIWISRGLERLIEILTHKLCLFLMLTCQLNYLYVSEETCLILIFAIFPTACTMFVDMINQNIITLFIHWHVPILKQDSEGLINFFTCFDIHIFNILTALLTTNKCLLSLLSFFKQTTWKY